MSESDSVDTSEWAHLWNEERYKWVLLKVIGNDLTSIEDCVIYDSVFGVMKLIENDDLSFAIKREMRNAGIPIVTKSQVGKPEFDYDKVVDEMSAAGRTIKEINAAIRQIFNARYPPRGA
jgi:hypothetical protein